MKVLALDIGGANLKYAIANIKNKEKKIINNGITSIYANSLDIFEMKLENSLIELSKGIDKIYFTTTAPLLYDSLNLGGKRIVKLIKDNVSLSENNIFYYSKNGNFKTLSEFKSRDIAGCYNWCITRAFIKANCDKDCLLIDCGSSSTDIVPINLKKSNENYAIHERILKNELLYLGMRRTIVQTITNNVLINSNYINVVGEPTTTIGDINYILGYINKEEYSIGTNILTEHILNEKAYFNIARLLCGDLNTFDEKTLKEICKYISSKTVEKIKDAIENVIRDNFDHIPYIVVCGIGSDFIKSKVIIDIPNYKMLSFYDITDIQEEDYTPAIGIIEII